MLWITKKINENGKWKILHCATKIVCINMINMMLMMILLESFRRSLAVEVECFYIIVARNPRLTIHKKAKKFMKLPYSWKLKKPFFLWDLSKILVKILTQTVRNECVWTLTRILFMCKKNKWEEKTWFCHLLGKGTVVRITQWSQSL